MITLHESNITSFPLDNGIGVLRDAIRAYTEEELNGMFEFYMEYDSEGHLVDELKEERIIKAKAQDKLGYQLFRIYSITKNHENDNLIIKAQHITYDLANNFVEELKAHKLTKKQVMELIGARAVEPHPFNVTSSNNTTVSSTNLYRTNPLQMIAGMEGSVLQIWGGQIERDNFNLILHDRRGHDDGVRVTYEKNITGLEATFDISGVITRIFPFVYIEATDEEPERLITVSGKYIDSPHINDYEVIRTEPIDYSSDDRINTDNKTDAQIRQQLTNVAKNYFKETGNDRIKVEMEVQFAHLWETEEYKDVKVLELVGMGDTVTIEHSKLKVNATAIVNYIKYDCIAQVNEEVKLGRVKARLTDNVNKIDTIERKVEQAESNANQAIVSANGKNTTYYGPDEPTNAQKGDLWFKVIDGQYHKTYRYDGIEWKEILDKDSQEAKAEAQQAKERAEEAVERANQATQQATDAINQAQASFDLAQENATTIDSLALRITGRNLISHNSFNWYYSKNLQRASSYFMDIEPRTIYTVKNHSDIEIGNVSINLYRDGDYIKTISFNDKSVTFNSDDADKFFVFFRYPDTDFLDLLGTEIKFKLEKGDMATEWTIHDVDPYKQFTTITATVDGLQTTVSDVQGNVSTLTQLSDTMQTRLSDVEGNVNTLTLTSQSMQSTISSLQDEWDNLEIGGRNLLVEGEMEWGYLHSSTGELIPTAVDGFYRTTGYIDVSNISTITLSQYDKIDDFDGRGRVLGYDKDKNFIGIIYNNVYTGSGWDKPKSITLNVSDVYYIRATLIWWGRNRYKLEKGTVATDWSPAPEDMATQSQITQLSDAINLGVTKGDVINQINLDTSGVLISGKKLILDGDTTVTGTFKVNNANITSLNAGKITAGTLDAGKISVVNLSANSINSGILTGIRIRQVSTNRVLDITNGRIHSYFNGNLAMSWGGYRQEFYARDGSAIGYFGPNSIADEPSKQGLAMVTQKDYISIGAVRDGYNRPVLRAMYNEGRTIVSGAYRGLLSGSTLSLYANSRLIWDDTPSRDIDQPAIILNQGENQNDNLQYFGGFNRRSGAVWEVRYNESPTSSIRKLRVSSNGTRVSQQLWIGEGNIRIVPYTDAVQWRYNSSNYIQMSESGQIDLRMGGSWKHSFYPNGTKAGGSIEIDGKNYGMSPIDSPQVLLEYIEFDIELSRFGTRIEIDKTFRKAISNFAVFPNNGNVVEKGDSYFVLKGEGIADVRIVGKRIGQANTFWADMERIDEPTEEGESENVA